MCLIAMSIWRLLCMRMYMLCKVEESHSLVVASSGELTEPDDSCRRLWLRRLKKLVIDGPPFWLDFLTVFPNGYLSSNSRLTKQQHGIAGCRSIQSHFGMRNRRRPQSDAGIIS